MRNSNLPPPAMETASTIRETRQESCGLIRHIGAAPLQASGAKEGGVKWDP